MTVRFIVSGYPRCGSTLLIDALEQHPQVQVFNEVFQEELERRFPVAGRIFLDGENGEEYIKHIFAQDYGPEKTAIGFKFFGQQARANAIEATAWTFLRDHPDIRVVYIDRENWLELVVSMEHAARTKEWSIWSESGKVEGSAKPKDLGPLTIEPKKCAHFFRDIDKSRQWVFHFAAGHPILLMPYAELAADFHEAMHRVHDFLGVDEHWPRVRTIKQATKTLRERVANYDELVEFFWDSPYRRFFEMDDVPVAAGQSV